MNVACVCAPVSFAKVTGAGPDTVLQRYDSAGVGRPSSVAVLDRVLVLDGSVIVAGDAEALACGAALVGGGGGGAGFTVTVTSANDVRAPSLTSMRSV